ncbi:unnamed protein product [Spirodela intermedia]|uniref:Uncharacterized protein n=2 Tax=Spirodela intermedia TaxID=51605 RepID=A0A7I8JWG0_SPIIN|nr:unnamed protein product [Spirodela intermedia]CAA6653764.1 unnamed protein product [Spirodela intermedia]CAA7388126.1 unnamed protein product [Spirodela intermedia]
MRATLAPAMASGLCGGAAQWRASCAVCVPTRCGAAGGQPQREPARRADSGELKIGSPIIVVEAPPTLKTATAMPSLRINNGLVKPGDVGRIVGRKPMDVWAVRLAIGTYLIDGKHFRSLDLAGEDPPPTSDAASQ